MQIVQASDSLPQSHTEASLPIQPFLRWAGGKTWFVKRYARQLSELVFDAYHEPFLGGGSVFFSMPSFRHSFLADRNAELIETYGAVKESPEEVISALGAYKNDEASYYEARSSSPQGDIARAARFIFLNQTSYNGIYRVNLRGEYNVPFGHRSKNFLDPQVIFAASKKLQNTKLYEEDFSQSLTRVNRGSLVFIDPPYTVSHNKNGFIKYNKNLFSLEDYYRLREYVENIRSVGAKYILTNAAHDKVREIFSFGDSVHEVSRANLIGGLKAARGQITELIFTNLGAEF